MGFLDLAREARPALDLPARGPAGADPAASSRSGCRSRCRAPVQMLLRRDRRTCPNGSHRADVVRLRPGVRARAGADDADRAPPAVRQELQDRGDRAVAGRLRPRRRRRIRAWRPSRVPQQEVRRRLREPRLQGRQRGGDGADGQGIASAFPNDYAAPDQRLPVAAAHAGRARLLELPAAGEHLGRLPGHEGVGAAGARPLPPPDGVGLDGGAARPSTTRTCSRGSCTGCSAAWRARPSTRSARREAARPRAAWTRSRSRTCSSCSASCSATLVQRSRRSGAAT